MARKFHRFADPQYYKFSGESFPGTPGDTGVIGAAITYDRVNVENEGTGGTSAQMDAQKAVGPSQFTYFVAFGEDGLSAHANRGLRALAENTDVLDDLFRTSVPRLASVVSGGSPTDSLQIVGQVYVGAGGTPYSELACVVDEATGRQAYTAGGAPIVVTAIDDGTPGNDVRGSAGGWYDTPTVRFSAAPLAAVRVHYGVRSSTARVVEAEPWALSSPHLALRKEVTAIATTAVRSTERVAAYGLNEWYRLASTAPVPAGTPDTPGAGGHIVRDGAALTLAAPPRSPTQFFDRALMLLRLGAQAEVGEEPWTDYTGSAFAAGGADIGIGWELPFRATAEATELAPRYRQGPISLGLQTPYFTQAAVGTLEATTLIRPTQEGSLVAGTATVNAGPGDYFSNIDDDQCALRTGLDLLEIKRASGAYETYLIVSYTYTTATVVGLDGTAPVFPNETVTMRVRHVVHKVGGTPIDNDANKPWNRPFVLGLGLQSLMTGAGTIAEPPAVEEPLAPLVLGARGGVKFITTAVPSDDGDSYEPGLDAYCGGKMTFFAGVQKTYWHRAHGGTGSYNFSSPSSVPIGGQVSKIKHIGSGLGLTIDPLTTVQGEAVTDGDWFVLVLERTQTAAGFTVTWPGDFVFSGDDGVVPAEGAFVIKFRGERLDNKWYITRTDY